jgi:hypothetical protein
MDDMPQPKGNLTLAGAPSGDGGGTEFFLSEPEAMEDGDGDWGFAVYAAKDIWLATFTYPSQHAASRAREALMPVLRECTFIATANSRDTLGSHVVEPPHENDSPALLPYPPT